MNDKIMVKRDIVIIGGGLQDWQQPWLQRKREQRVS